MIRNEDTYCIVPHKIVRELGACEAIVFSTIIGLLRKSDGIGEIGNSTLMDMCGINNSAKYYRFTRAQFPHDFMRHNTICILIAYHLIPLEKSE